MNRRRFIQSLAIGAGGLSLTRSATCFSSEAPQVAITIDDFNWRDTTRLTPDERNGAILAALAGHSNLKAAMFVCGKYIDNEQGKRLLDKWEQARHTIANHSYSHHYYHSPKVSFQTFADDLLKGEAVIKDFSHFKKLFRFPYLKEGDTIEKRDGMRAFLKDNGYRNGHVTIDASDWYVDDRLRKRLAKDPAARLSPYRDFYLSHLWDRAAFYDDLARKVVGRAIKHTLLIHHNLLNALFLGDALRMFRSKGWKLIDANQAYTDPVFDSAPKILPAGESLLWALAKETGRFENVLRYPGEDSVYEKEKMDKLGL
jgi:peptidoglycan-N-acetylglucosamine deacetylase